MGTVLDPRLSGFNAALSTSVNFGGKTYQQYGTDILQQKIDRDALYATDVFDVQEEQVFGTLNWSNIFKTRICHILSDKQTGEKLGDDFRQLVFLDRNHIYGLGHRYFFDNNIFLTVNTDFYKYPTLSSTIRRCDNTLNSYDSNGAIHIEPCVIDYQIRSTDFDYDQNIILPDGVNTAIVQGNDYTREYKINQRFIYGQQAFKIINIKNYHRVNTLDKNSVNIIRLIMMKDNISPNDDLINEIANIDTYVYTLTLNTEDFSQSVGFTTTLNPTIKLNGEIVTKNVEYISSDITKATVTNAGLVTLISNGSVTITCRMVDNHAVNDSVNITIATVPVNVREVIIDPLVEEILQTQEQIYNVYLYINGVQQVNTFTFAGSNVPINNYTLSTISGNSFKIKNIQKYLANPLRITCTSGTDIGTIDILLKGVF